MPHGAGCHGGGGGGFGGGFGGHHSFGGHHNHCHSNTPWIFYGGAHGNRRNTRTVVYRRPWSVVSFVIVFVVVVVILSTTLSVHTSHSSTTKNHDITYTSRDTNLIGYSSKFCDRLSITGDGILADRVMVNLYLLKSEPTKTKQGLITFSKSSSIFDSYEYWFFHLLPNSRINFSACLQGGSTAATFYLVKGTKNFAKWTKNGDRHYEETKSISNYCDFQPSQDYSYDVSSSDHYYLVFENSVDLSLVDITFNITQVQYVVSPDIVINNCSVPLDSDKSCNLPVDFSSDYTKALLQLEPEGEFINWEANNVVHIGCRPRAWFYALICIPSAGGVVILVAIAVALLVLLYRRRKRKSHQTSASAGIRNVRVAPSAPKPDNTPLINTEITGESQPPPYNYDYNTLPAYKP